ncbi:MAG: threonine/serine exporter family protein [Acutalibacteraceae bacterium]
MADIIIKTISGVVSTVGFGIIFKLKIRQLPFAALDGLCACIVYFICTEFFEGLFLPNILAAFAAALLAEVFARACKAPTTVFVYPGCIALVPGGYLYYAMQNLLMENNKQAMSYFLDTLVVGISIGGGIILASLCRYIVEFFKKRKSPKTVKQSACKQV